MKKRKMAGIFLSVLCLASLCACGKGEEAGQSRIRVGVLCYDQSDTFLSELTVSLKEQFQKDGVDAALAFFDATGSQRTQDDQVKELVNEDCDVWCVNLVDRTAPSEVIDAGIENDVPIIFFNREPVAEDMMRWDKLYYVGTDARQSGEIQGELAAEAIRDDPKIDRNNDGRIQYVVLEGEPGHQDAIIRTENAVNELKDQGIVLDKLGCGIANWNRAQAQNRMMQLIEQNKTEIELVLSNNDDMALGAIDVYEKLNYTESNWPVIFGIDGTKAGLEAVKEGKLAGSVYNDKEGQAHAIEQLALALVTGQGMDQIDLVDDKYVYLPYDRIDKTNVDRYMESEIN